MKILIVEDNLEEQVRAKDSCAGHEVVVVDNFEKAQDILWGKWSDEEQKVVKSSFDIVLTDLMLPATDLRLSPEATREFCGKEMPLGTIVALLAIRQGCKVAIVTDTNHHDHPMSAALDSIMGFTPGGIWEPIKNITANSSKQWQVALKRLTTPTT